MQYIPLYSSETLVNKGESPTSEWMVERAQEMRRLNMRCIGQVWNHGLVPLWETTEVLTETELQYLCLQSYTK
jgi:hypothetical protein